MELIQNKSWSVCDNSWWPKKWKNILGFVIQLPTFISQELLNKIRNNSITHNIFRIQYGDSIMCGFYCIAFIEYMLAGKGFLDYTNLFTLNDYKKNEKIIYAIFHDKYVKYRV